MMNWKKCERLDASKRWEDTEALTSPPAWIGVSEKPKGLLHKKESECERAELSLFWKKGSRKAGLREGDIGLVTLDEGSIGLGRFGDRNREIFERDLSERGNDQYEDSKRKGNRGIYCRDDIVLFTVLVQTNDQQVGVAAEREREAYPGRVTLRTRVLNAADNQSTGERWAGVTTESPVTVRGTISPAKNLEKTSPSAASPAASSR